jgi:hypothetical protein
VRWKKLNAFDGRVQRGCVFSKPTWLDIGHVVLVIVKGMRDYGVQGNRGQESIFMSKGKEIR